MLLPLMWQLSIHLPPSQMILQHVRAVRKGFSLIAKLEWTHWPHITHTTFFKKFWILHNYSLITTLQFLKAVVVQSWKNLSLLRWACEWREVNKKHEVWYGSSPVRKSEKQHWFKVYPSYNTGYSVFKVESHGILLSPFPRYSVVLISVCFIDPCSLGH